MDPILGLVGSIGGGIINNLFAGSRQSDAQKFAQQQAATAEAYFRTNRQTAYQDTMQSMREAGLNPILAYSQGAVSAPMGTTPSPSAAPVSDVGIGQGVKSALDIRAQNQMLENQKAQVALTNSQTAKTNQETATERERTIGASTDNIKNTWSLDRAWQDYNAAKNQNAWIDANPGLTRALQQSGYAVGLGADVAKPIVNTVKDAIPFLGSSAKSTTPAGGPPGGSSSFADRWPSGRPMGNGSSARSNSTADPGFIPGGIRDRSFRGLYGEPF